jgi:phage terminase large subunit-like protein
MAKKKPKPDALWFETDPRLAEWRKLRETEPGLMLTNGHKPEVQWAMDAKLLTEGYYFDFDAAQHFVDFAETYCPISDGEYYGQCMPLAPHQLAENRRIYGWKRADGMFRYSTIFKMVARKNIKSFEAAMHGLYLTGFAGELGASVYSCASNRNQAEEGVFKQAISMCELSDALAPLCDVVKSRAVILMAHAGNASFRAISSGRGHHGKNVFGVILDEVHEFRNRAMYEAMTTASGAKRQSIVYMITTAGDDINTLCYEQYQYACKIRDGILQNPSFLPIIWEVPTGDDWKNEENWKKANPMLGRSVKIEYLRDRFKLALASSAEEASFRRYHLNQWINDAERWEHLTEWLDCVGEEVEGGKIPASLMGKDCYIGLDLSRKYDLTSVCLLFRVDIEQGDELKPGYRALWWHFIPEKTAHEKARKDGVPYHDWIDKGWIIATPGDVVDLRLIREKIVEISQQVNVLEVRYDPRFATEISQNLQDDGLPMVEQVQRMPDLSAAFAEVERAVRTSTFEHGDNPVLRWMASNLTLYQRGGMAIPDKDVRTGRIDGFSALCNAMCGAVTGSNARSVYEDRGVVVLGGE